MPAEKRAPRRWGQSGAFFQVQLATAKETKRRVAPPRPAALRLIFPRRWGGAAAGSLFGTCDPLARKRASKAVRSKDRTPVLIQVKAKDRPRVDAHHVVVSSHDIRVPTSTGRQVGTTPTKPRFAPSGGALFFPPASAAVLDRLGTIEQLEARRAA